MSIGRIPAAKFAKVRALLLAGHVFAISALSLPGAQIARGARWESRLMQKDMADWAAELEKVGVHTTPEALTERLRGLAEAYVEVRSTLLAPFSFYATVTGARQSWSMFASPQRRPYEFHVDGRTRGGWLPLYRPHDPEARLLSEYLLHNRMRKFQGRFARAMNDQNYEDFARFVARRVLELRPDVSEVRIALYGYSSLPPERVRNGERPEGAYDNIRLFPREAP